MKIDKYVFELTVFQPELVQKQSTFKQISEAMVALRDLPINDAVIFVAALGDGIDHGNFHLFLNGDGMAHVMLHEHREFCPIDPSFRTELREIEFRDEDGTRFTVEAALATSAVRGKIALEHWLLNQTRWQEFIWQ